MNDNEEQTTTRFQFVRHIGRGVLGEVYEVLDEVRAEHVVLKIFLRAQPAHMEEFRLEFQSLGRLTHPNLVRFHHLVDPTSDTNDLLEEKLGTHGLAFTQEFVPGHDLLKFLKLPPTAEELTTLELRQVHTGEVPSAEVLEDAPHSGEVEADTQTTLDLDRKKTDQDESHREVAQVLQEFTALESPIDLDLVFLRLERILPQLLQGLEHLHRYHKVHGSLRPSNILVVRHASPAPGECPLSVKLTDYGLASGLVSCQAKGGQTPFTLAPENLPFLAPEVMDGKVTEQSDLFALGCVLFEAIAGFSPHERMEWTRSALRSPPLADCVPECPSSWARLVDALLERNPAERPSLKRVLEVIASREARAVVLPPTVVSEPKTFLGRQEVLEQLKELALGVADNRTMRFVQLDGEVGVGKSTMVRALSHWLGRRGWLVIRGGFPRRELGPFGGWTSIAKELADLCDQLPAAVQESLAEDRKALSHILPAISHLETPGEGYGRPAAVAGLRAVLAQLSHQRPLLLCLDDLQWASWDSSALLLDLLSETNELRCMVLGSWHQGVTQEEEHLLHTDLDMTLFSTTQLTLRGYDAAEAEEYARLGGGTVDATAMQRRLKKKTLNPLMLRELRWEKPDINEALEELLAQVDARSGTRDLLAALYSRRFAKLGKRELAILGLLAVSPIPLTHDTLCHAAELELSSSVIPKEGTESAIDHSLEFLKEQRLIREQPAGFVIAQEPIRQMVMDAMSDRDEARYCGKIADVLISSKDAGPAERFEFERRSGRIGPALEFAMLAAEDAEVRYAYHRAAKIWRWILEHEAQLPEYELVRPTSELARVEHLAGRHGRAAELFHQAAHVKPHKRMLSKLEEAQAWMQASQLTAAQTALHEGLEESGRGYESRMLERWIAGIALWSRGGDGFSEQQIPSGSATPAQLAETRLLHFALEWSDWLDPRMSDVLEWRLSRLARQTADPVVVGVSRLQTALGEMKSFSPMSVTRALQRLSQARTFFKTANAEAWGAQSYVIEGWIHLQNQDYTEAMKAFATAEFEAEGVEDSTGFDDRLLQAWKGLAQVRQGELDDAEHTARHLLHIHRGDGVARALAAQLLTEVALFRGETSRAERMLDILASIQFPRGSVQEVVIARLHTRLNLALGQPEVAIAQIEMLLEAPTSARWMADPTQRLLVKLALGQAIAANATRQKSLGEDQLHASIHQLRKIVRQIMRFQNKVDTRTRLEIIRLTARLDLLRDQPKKALRMINTPNLDGLKCDRLTSASMREARGVILNRMEKGEGKSEQEQAREVYERQRCFYPLVFEGWPIPRSLMTLKDD